MRKILLLVVWLVFLGLADNAKSLIIIRDFQGGTPPTNSIGAGNFHDIFNTACDTWESIIKDPFSVTIHIRWDKTNGTVTKVNAQGGNPWRITEATITINSDNDPDHFSYYLDPTPLMCEEATNYMEVATNLGGGSINVTRWFQFPVPRGTRQADLFTVLMHEIGHALGMSVDYFGFTSEAYDHFINVTVPRPFPGTAVPMLVDGNGVSQSHIADIGPRTLMRGSYGPGDRVLMSTADIISIAQVSGFTNLELNPAKWAMNMGPILQKPIVADGMVTISWIQPVPAPSNKEYKVQKCTDLQSGAWMTLSGTPSLTDGVYSLTLLAIDNVGFFRLSLQDAGGSPAIVSSGDNH